MDVFAVHRRLIEDYRAFTEGGTVIRDDRIAAFVEEDLDAGSQWPNPWVSLNPSFASGGTVRELVEQQVLHEECASIFQAGKTRGRHQLRRHPAHPAPAPARGDRGGRSRRVLRPHHGHRLGQVPVLHRADRRPGAQAREKEGPSARPGPGDHRLPDERPGQQPAARSWRSSCGTGTAAGKSRSPSPATPARRTTRSASGSCDNPPDILLTNYVMLELMLTRPDERRSLIRRREGLRFLVLDELHTYRGRQGADVAMLVRRVREACKAPTPPVRRHLRHDGRARAALEEQTREVAERGDARSSAPRSPRARHRRDAGRAPPTRRRRRAYPPSA